MTRLSVNLNKVCLLRNSRGSGAPDPVEAARVAIRAGAGGLTLHPREDRRHATLEDVQAFAALPEVKANRIELNVEGDLRPDLIAAVISARAHQYTVVPVEPGEITSHRGWREHDNHEALRAAVRRLQPATRVSVFVDPDPGAVARIAEMGAACIEIYTGPYAQAFATENEADAIARVRKTAEAARRHGLLVNAGHDLDTRNLAGLIRAIRPDEVSIGHALMTDALWSGLAVAVGRYVEAIAKA